MQDSTVDWIVHHEIGHALGLLGHSPVAQDIMYFVETPSSHPVKLTQRDVNTLCKLYKTELGPTMCVLNDEGLEASRQGNLELAIRKFQAALKLESSAPAPLHNLARAEHSLGVKLARQGNLAAAEQHFKSAVEYAAKPPHNDLAAILTDYERLLRMIGKTREANELRLKYKVVY